MALMDIYEKIHNTNKELDTIERKLYGSKSKREVGQKNDPNINQRVWYAMGGTNTSYGPTKTQKESFEIASEEFSKIRVEVEQITTVVIPEIEKQVIESGVPWIEGQPIPE